MKKYNLTDIEIMRKRQSGESIMNIAKEAGASYGTMYRKIEKLSETKNGSGIQLYDTLGDGNGGFWTVAEITEKQYVIKNRETGRTERINKRLFNSGETMYHKLETSPVKVYNLNDTKEPEKKVAPAEEIKELVGATVKPQGKPLAPMHRRYIERIECILDVARPECQSETQYLYELVSEIFRNGFDAEFVKGEQNNV